MKTAHTYFDPFSTTGTHARAVEISDIVEVAGKRGYVASLSLRLNGTAMIEMARVASSSGGNVCDYLRGICNF